MTDTVLSSATKEVVIGFDRPFVVIGERINPTGRKILAEEMKVGNFDTVIADAIAQVEAGAQMLDVNAGIPLADEPAILRQTIELVQSITDVPLCHPCWMAPLIHSVRCGQHVVMVHRQFRGRFR